MTARRAAILDQVNAATADLMARRIVVDLPGLSPRHRAAAVLGNRLLIELDSGLSLCAHLRDLGPQLALWSPSAPALQCGPCATKHSATTRTNQCDHCNEPASLEPFGLQFGPVLLMPCLCTRCARPDRRTDVDHRIIRRQVTDHVVRLYEEAAS